MSTPPFAHLHCHTHYSLLDGASPIDKLIKRTVEYGMNALAITDHGNLHGAIEFYKSAKAAGINPIIGYEAYVASTSRFKKSMDSQEQSYHLTLLCQNRTGFRNLIKLASSAFLEGFYFKPRIDKELLERHSEGLICLSGCVSSEFNQKILAARSDQAGDYLAAAKDVAGWFHRVFGDRYFIEIMNNGVEIQRVALEGSVELARQMGLPLVATSDCHYVDADDADAQDVMLCINTGRFRTDNNRMKMDGTQYFLRTPQQMYEKFPGLEDAVRRSQEIADSVQIDLELGKRHFPIYNLPSELTADDYLREVCLRGLRERYSGNPEMCPEGELAPVVMQRLERELGVIRKLGFSNYFLIVWDFVNYARSQRIPATARGSGVGALVCFALYLSHVCPIRYGLLFERFLDENRLEAPDIDIDFCQERRGEVIRYVKEKYGDPNVAQIGTFNTMAARAAIKDVGRVLGVALGRVNQITSLVPARPGITLEEAMEEVADLRAMYANDPEVREVIDYAYKLEGLARNIGTHAAAVVIGDRPLTEYVPLGSVPGKEDVITQWSMSDVEAAGLLKMDMLGLRNLTILSAAVDLIEQTNGTRIDPLKFPLDDGPTYALLQRGETKGVFQLESGGIRDLLQKMKPDRFWDIIATNALYRPGPLEGGLVQQYVEVKNGRRQAEYLHPVLKDITEETHGVMVYQEQVMQILNRLGKIPLAAAYTCIKAISKKKEKIIAENYEQFVAGSTEQGLKKSQAQELWDMILKFAGYGFNKSHSTAYALIAYQTAYLKAHYPTEFMAALLTGDISGRNFSQKDSLVEHIEDCQRMGIEVVPPSVNSSAVKFSVAGKRIHFALCAIKGCGESAAEAIVRERAARGPFRDLFDFCERIESSSCNRAAIESLIKAGAMDCFGARRSQLQAILDRALQSGVSAQSDRKSGQKSLFGDLEEEEETTSATPVGLPEIPEMDQRELLAAEKEVLGFYLSAHPLEQYADQLKKFCAHSSKRLGHLEDRARVSLGGMVSSIKHSNVKRAKDPTAPTKYVMFDLEDLEGSIRCIQWPSEFATQGHLIQSEAILIIQGVLDRRGGDEANLVVDKVIPLEQAEQSMTNGLCLRVSEKQHGPQAAKDIYEIVRGYPGSRKLRFDLRLDDGTTVILDTHKLKIDIHPELRRRLEEYLGKDAIEILAGN
ncbi:MAG: DNA polymerase III subunit alpha [Planctomycetota bacterium]